MKTVENTILWNFISINGNESIYRLVYEQIISVILNYFLVESTTIVEVRI